ncbi:hypothetical protein KR093_006635 [Drosophila rubida]|uniref:Uncharacterized protein n=1 Tax=Drosophila rubida TaxID=30044 RepID=A0AAD4KCD1_9MUSC|nr:hypothetical protein KR093_006635 [Drosophila rubida]
MEENGKLYGMVEVDQLRSTWKARKFPIEVPALLMQSGLLPSIFDWPLLGQLMPMEQAMGEAMLQQRINDLELLNSLTTSLQRIEIRAETGIGIDVVLGRPSYNVLVQDNGSILVKELPSLHIHVYAVESRAAAGQECKLDEHDEHELMLPPSASASQALSASASALASEQANNKQVAAGQQQQQQQQPQQQQQQQQKQQQQQQEEQEKEQEEEQQEEQQELEGKESKDESTDSVEKLLAEMDEELEKNEQQEQSLQLAKFEQNQQEALEFLCGNLTSLSEDGDEPETDFLTESEEQADNKLHRRMSFWMRVGHFLRQNIPRLN